MMLTWICDFSDDVCDVGLVRHVVDRQSILVVSIADVATGVASVWTSVDETFGIVNISIS